MARHVVGRASELPPGSRKIVEVGDGGRTVGVFNVNGQYHALLNRCPHQAAPLCRGAIKGTAMPSAPGEYVWGREGEILRCPWHGWEFDLTNGRSIFNPHKLRVRTYEVTVEALPDGTVAPAGAPSSEATLASEAAASNGDATSARANRSDAEVHSDAFVRPDAVVHPDAAVQPDAADEERVETFPVTVEDGWVILHA